MRRIMNSEKGQALPLALLALAVGALVTTPFLVHASSSLIGSRTYGQAITEQYSCDAGVEWALWRLKENPVLTTDTAYDSTVLEPFPSEINGSSFPTTEVRFVEYTEATETITPEWQAGAGWHNYPVGMAGAGTITVVIETDASYVKIQLGQTMYHLIGGSPYTAEFEVDSGGTYIIEVQTPSYEGSGIITITTTSTIAIYDIRAQKGDRTITVRATASYLATRVMSWQIE